MARRSPPETLRIVLGDQLDPRAPGLRALDASRDALWMAETHAETAECHPRRVAAFLAAMRHFRDEQERRGLRVHYTELPKDPSLDRGRDFAELLQKDLATLRPKRLRVTRPGDLRVEGQLERAAEEAGVPLEIEPDPHFIDTPESFAEWASGRKEWILEHYYRALRKRTGILMDDRGEPIGGRWNFDEDNRKAFGKRGPGRIPAPRSFTPDDVTRDVVELVEARFADSPGRLEDFDLPVTRRQARAALADFVSERLPLFGTYEDALWEGEPFLYHSRLSFALNVKLIDPRECIDAAVEALGEGAAPINAVEGFVRQLLGWREFVRGVYFATMPDYVERNALRCKDRPMPAVFWDGGTDMRCVADAMSSVLRYGYAHHIQRLMVLGLFAQLLGVHPRRFHEWHMALYVDAIDWVSLPNTLGMSQWGDGGVVGTKPYCATGAYVQRMSNHCSACRYDPKKSVGDDACPLTTLYWDFLARHRKTFGDNRRMALQMRNLDRKPPEEVDAIRRRAKTLIRRTFEGRAP